MYNVVENVAGSLRFVAEAQHVIAFCGTRMYIVKSRDHNPDPMPRERPDKVIAYYTHPEPHIEELEMRKKV